MKKQTKDRLIENLTQQFYRLMPGAPNVPVNQYTDYREAWGEVDMTEHYRFCQFLASQFVALGAGKTAMDTIIDLNATGSEIECVLQCEQAEVTNDGSVFVRYQGEEGYWLGDADLHRLANQIRAYRS